MDINVSNFELLIDQKDIKSKIIELAQKIDEDYKDKEIVVLIILKGSLIFASDFLREIKTPFVLETIKCSSYGKKGKERGELLIQGFENLELRSKNILIIDDIFDSGNTIATIKNEILKQSPASVRSLVLLLKKTIRRTPEDLFPDYYLFEIEDNFVIGYGLDYKEYFRGLKSIYFIE